MIAELGHYALDMDAHRVRADGQTLGGFLNVPTHRQHLEDLQLSGGGQHCLTLLL